MINSFYFSLGVYVYVYVRTDENLIFNNNAGAFLNLNLKYKKIVKIRYGASENVKGMTEKLFYYYYPFILYLTFQINNTRSRGTHNVRHVRRESLACNSILFVLKKRAQHPGMQSDVIR